MHLKRYVRIDLGTAQTVYVHFICNLMGYVYPGNGWVIVFYLFFIFIFSVYNFLLFCCYLQRIFVFFKKLGK